MSLGQSRWLYTLRTEQSIGQRVASQDKPINDEDAALFRAAVGAVTSLPEQGRILHLTPPRHAYITDSSNCFEIADTLTDNDHSMPPADYCSNGISRMSLRRLARGYWPVQESLDLHGLHSDTARRTLQEFLHYALERHVRCVLVIHGKGLNSKSGEAILKIRTRHWLIQHPSVLAYSDAPTRLGGGGAAIILLRVSS